MSDAPLRQPRPVVFLKLGGALLTDKRARETVRASVLPRLAAEIAAFAAAGEARLVLGHGSGSFAHFAVRETAFLDRPTPMALARVAASARRLDTIVADACIGAGLPVVPLPAMTLARSIDGELVSLNADVVRDLLETGLVPMLYGDVLPDAVAGGIVASTETLLVALAQRLRPLRIVLATDVDGVFGVDPHRDPSARALATIRAADAPLALGAAGAALAEGVDVTGGMGAKVRAMLALVAADPSIEVRIVSGLRPGALRRALAGDAEAGGTLIRA